LNVADFAMNWPGISFGAVVLVGSFFVTYWLTEPEAAKSESVEFSGLKQTAIGLSKLSVDSADDLRSAAQHVGLRLSPDFKGFVEQIRRVGDKAEITGWVVDLRGIGEPTQVFAFTGGKLVASAETRGERVDVTRVLNLEGDQKSNVRFAFDLNCRSGDTVRAFVANRYGHYSILNGERCP
jgi:hypothetical protein